MKLHHDHGIEIDDTTWSQLQDTACGLGVAWGG
jgi:hypothetical protein